MSALLKLAERCELATAPDVMLERDIAVALGWKHLPNKGPERDEYPFCWVVADGTPDFDGFPDYVHSLDAAITLVPEGPDYFPSLSMLFNRRWRSAVYEQWQDVTWTGVAATPALALCAAALKVRAASADTRRDGEDAVKLAAEFTSGAAPEGQTPGTRHD